MIYQGKSYPFHSSFPPMWNPIVIMDFNNLFRTLDKMGQEVKHRLSLLLCFFLCSVPSSSSSLSRAADSPGSSLESSTCRRVGQDVYAAVVWQNLLDQVENDRDVMILVVIDDNSTSQEERASLTAFNVLPKCGSTLRHAVRQCERDVWTPRSVSSLVPLVREAVRRNNEDFLYQ